MPMPLLKRALLSVGCEREAIPSPQKIFKTFQKTIDKYQKGCYNKYRKREGEPKQTKKGKRE